MRARVLLGTVGTPVVVGLVALAAMAGVVNAAETRFTVVDSSPSSWVARGYDNYTVSPSTGWTFTASGGPRTVQIYVSGSPLPNTSVDYWRMTFDAPDAQNLAPGVYANVQRYPFNDAGRPGLEFASSGRLDNMAAGKFEILQIEFGPSNELISFAANFTHYGETDPSRYAIAEVRYNADVPEPASLSVLGTGGALLLLRRRRR